MHALLARGRASLNVTTIPMIRTVFLSTLLLSATIASAQTPIDTRAGATLPATNVRHARVADCTPDSTDIFTRRQAPPTDRRVPPKKLKFGVLKIDDSEWTAANAQPGYYILDGYTGDLSCQTVNQAIKNIVAAEKVGTTMYCISYSEDLQHIYYTKLNTSTWTTSGYQEEVDNVNVASDFTFDEKTNGVYGFFYCEDDYSAEFRNFARWNLSTAEPSKLAIVEREVYACAAAEGDIYWLSSTQLGKINPANPASSYTYLGNPRLYPEGLHNTMAYDPGSKLLYALTTESDMKLGVKYYTTSFSSIDPVTKEVTKIREFPSTMGFAGLFLLPEEYSDDAPAEVPDAQFSFASAADGLTATVEVTAPSYTFSGATLSEPVSLIVALGGTEYIISDVQPGAKASSQPIPVAEGELSFTISAATASERGPERVFTTFAGFDIPEAPANVLLEERDEKPYLSWTAPTKGATGGSIDTANLSYRVVRNLDGQCVATGLTATSFVDAGYTPSARPLSYTVTAVTPQGESLGATSNSLALGVRFDAPYIETFDTTDDFDLWSVVNVNGGSTWDYDSSNKAASYRYDDNQLPADDWLISPPIHLQPGKIYTANYAYRVMLSSYPESFTVALGTTADPTDFTTVLANHPSVSNTRFENGSVPFSVESEGDFYLGFQANSKAYQYILLLDNLGIDALDANVPAAPIALTVSPAERGELSANISLTAPTVDADGKELEAITELRLCRSDLASPLHTFPAPQPGESLSFTDNTLSAAATYTYVAYAVNVAGAGLESRTQAFIGTDVPDAVEQLTLIEVNGKPQISWSAPTKGRNGGWFDADKLSYSVYRYFDDLECIAEKTSATTVTDNALTIPATEQMVASYVVVPYADGASGRAIESNYILLGNPYQAPLTENFPAAGMNLYPWMSYTDIPISSAWTLDAVGSTPAASDFTGDGGMATFHSAGETQIGVGSWFVSPKISMKNLTRPSLSFALYHSSLPEISTREEIQLFVAADGSEEYTPVSEVYLRDNGTTGWTRYTLDVSEIAYDEYVRFAFRGTTAGGADIYLDAFAIDEGRSYDAAIESVAGPSKIAVNETGFYTLSLSNLGTADFTALNVAVAVDNNQPTTLSLGTLAAGQRVQTDIPVLFETVGNHTLSFTISSPNDENLDNNTAQKAVAAVEPIFPVATDLKATILEEEKSIALSWTAADRLGAHTDNFESYTPWAIDNIGEWIMVDRDFDLTAFIDAGAAIPGALRSYPNCQDEKAWQVCDADELGIIIWPQGTPHSGNRMLMASGSLNYVNSDWAISPILNGAEQVIDFYAKSFTTDGSPEERFRFLYSTGSTEPNDFIPVGTSAYTSVPETWTRYRFSVPAGARRFAIQCVSDGGFALFLDDVTFNDMTVPAAVITGYEVLRNGEAIATTSSTEYTDNKPIGGEVTYSVRTIYDKGTSAESAPVLVNLSGIETITLDDLEADDAEYFTPQGLRVARPERGNIYIRRTSAGTVSRILIP